MEANTLLRRLLWRQPAGDSLSRRRFLAGLGALAGAGAVAPLFLRDRGARPTSVEASRPALGTWVRVVARSGDPARAERAIAGAFAALRAVDAQMSLHRADSQLARVNAAAGRGAVRVDAALLGVAERAAAAARASGGVYDPTVLPLMRLYGFYDSGRRRFPTDREIADALARTGWSHVVADRSAGTLGLARPGAGLDLGSIGKGWALDRAVAALRAAGIESGLVDVGGNVYGLGVPEDGAAGWAVGVLHPATGRIDRTFHLRDAAVATSGNAEQHHPLGAREVGHLLDARRGRPADGPLSVSILAATGTESDVLSTVAFLLGPDRFRGWAGARAAHFIG
jgi:thiamine biosynthesis lipoprotein